jgi:hypothetical protein
LDSFDAPAVMLRVYPFDIRTGTGSQWAVESMNRVRASGIKELRFVGDGYRHVLRAGKVQERPIGRPEDGSRESTEIENLSLAIVRWKAFVCR